MKALSLIAAVAVVVLFTGCSHNGPKVVERADDMGSAPSWVSISRPSWEEDGKKYFLGWVELDADASKSAALNMSDEKALSEPMRALVDEFLDQNQVGESIRQSRAFGQRIISSTRGFRVPMPSLTIVKRYYEVTGHDERFDASLRAYSLAEISVKDFERAKQEYLERLAGNSEMRNILREVGKAQRDRILKASSDSDEAPKKD